jgi:hypothetical protein
LPMLVTDGVQQQVRRDAGRGEPVRPFEHTSMAELAQQVTALCQGLGRIPADYSLASYPPWERGYHGGQGR